MAIVFVTTRVFSSEVIRQETEFSDTAGSHAFEVNAGFSMGGVGLDTERLYIVAGFTL